MALRSQSDLWRSWQPGHAPALVVIPLGLIVAVCVVDVLAPPHIHLGPLLVAAPAITVAFAGARMTALMGVLAVTAQVLVGQYPRRLWIALKFDDVLMAVVRSHKLGLRAAAQTTNVLNCFGVHCDVPVLAVREG